MNLLSRFIHNGSFNSDVILTFCDEPNTIGYLHTILRCGCWTWRYTIIVTEKNYCNNNNNNNYYYYMYCNYDTYYVTSTV